MSPFRRLSLRDHLTVISAFAVAIALVLASLVVFLATRANLRDQLDSTLEALSTNAEPQEGQLVGRFAISLDAGRLSGERGVAQFVTASGELPHIPEPPFPSSILEAPGQDTLMLIGPERFLPITEQSRAVAAGSSPAYFEDVLVGDVSMRVFTRQIVPGVAVQVAQPLDEIDSLLSRLIAVLVAVTLGGALVAAFFGRAVARSALARVGRLTDVAEDVTQTNDFSKRMEVEGSDELSRLALGFNAMLDTLEASISSQRQLVADASHELRTPLTSIRTNIEVLGRAEELPLEERRKIVHEITGQIEELGSLVANLVELARDGSPSTQIEVLALDELVADVVERMRRLNPHVDIELSVSKCSIEGDRHRVDRAVTNLLDNAVKWTPPGETVHVEVTGGEVVVRDGGPGIDPGDLPHIFDRFYRAPGARGKPGSGLGLAIVHEVATGHGGFVVASNSPSGGAVFRLALPSLS